MAPHELVFLVSVLVFGLVEVVASVVTSWNQRPAGFPQDASRHRRDRTSTTRRPSRQLEDGGSGA